MPFDDEFAINIEEDFKITDSLMRELRPRLSLITCHLSLVG